MLRAGSRMESYAGRGLLGAATDDETSCDVSRGCLLVAYAASGCRLALALALRLADTRSRSAQFIAPQCASTQRTAVCATAPRREGVEDRNAAEATDETMAARRPLGTLTNTQPAAAPPPTKPAAPKPAVYRCDHCFSFTGSYAAVAAHEATCPCAAPGGR